MAYNNIATRNPVTVGATDPVKLFDLNTATRIGWRVVIPTTALAVRFKAVNADGTAPTQEDMLAGGSFRAGPGVNVSDDASASIDIYVLSESGSVDLYPEEILQ